MDGRKKSQFEKGDRKKARKFIVEIESKIAEGAFGEVYLVQDYKKKEDKYALKVIDKNFVDSNQKLKQLLSREITIMSTLNH